MTFFASVDGGLSSHASNPAGAQDGLETLIDSATAVFSGRAKISAFLGATAGLRLLPGHQQSALLQVAETTLEKKFPGASVKVIDGRDEAEFQWRTVSFLTGDSGAVVVDLGGGSVQLAYKSHKAPENVTQKQYMQPLPEGGHLFVHSWLGFGLRAARMKILETSSESACVARRVSYTYGDRTVEVDGLNAIDRAKACSDQVAAAMRIGSGCEQGLEPCAFNGGWRGPSAHAPGNTYYLFSYVYDVSVRLKFLRPEMDGAELQVEALVRAATEACDADRLDSAHDPEHDLLCLDATFVAVFVSQGLGLHADQKINVAHKLDYRGASFEASWPLGAALANQEL